MSQESISSLRERYIIRAEPMSARSERALELDPRKGVQALLGAIRRRTQLAEQESMRLRKLLHFELALWESDVEHVAGVDEAGMGPLAGPVAAAAVILARQWRCPGVDDSKKLSATKREKLERIIKQEAVAWCVVFVGPEEIDEMNVFWAGITAMERAVRGLSKVPGHLLVDARKLDRIEIPCTPIIRGDQKSLSIAAASILAKTARDRHMIELDSRYPGYGFSVHKGYPVASHREALRRLGPTPAHRRSFALVRESLESRRLESVAQ